MKNTKKKLKGQSRVVKYMNKQGIVKSISILFPTEWHSATKIGVNQVLNSIAMSSFCGKQQGAAKGFNTTRTQYIY